MNFSTITVSLISGLTSLMIGVMPMAVAESSSLNQSDWITINNPSELMQISFPRKPLESKFIVPFKNISKDGKLHVYSLPVERKQGLLVLSVLTSSIVGENYLNPKQFKKNFELYLVNYLFNEPQFFNHRQSFESTLHKFDSIAVLSFQFSYENHEGRQLIKGAALVHKDKLYQLFYLAPELEYNEEILEKFISTFSILD